MFCFGRRRRRLALANNEKSLPVLTLNDPTTITDSFWFGVVVALFLVLLSVSNCACWFLVLGLSTQARQPQV